MALAGASVWIRLTRSFQVGADGLARIGSQNDVYGGLAVRLLDGQGAAASASAVVHVPLPEPQPRWRYVIQCGVSIGPGYDVSWLVPTPRAPELPVALVVAPPDLGLPRLVPPAPPGPACVVAGPITEAMVRGEEPLPLVPAATEPVVLASFRACQVASRATVRGSGRGGRVPRGGRGGSTPWRDPKWRGWARGDEPPPAYWTNVPRTSSVGPARVGSPPVGQAVRAGPAAPIAPATPARPGPYDHLKPPKRIEPGGETTRAQRRRMLEENERQHGGKLKDDVTGQDLVRPQRHQFGTAPPSNEAQVDHVVPRSRGGDNSYGNLRIRSREANLKKAARLPTDPERNR